VVQTPEPQNPQFEIWYIFDGLEDPGTSRKRSSISGTDRGMEGMYQCVNLLMIDDYERRRVNTYCTKRFSRYPASCNLREKDVDGRHWYLWAMCMEVMPGQTTKEQSCGSVILNGLS
jgi:hypothetical protein